VRFRVYGLKCHGPLRKYGVEGGGGGEGEHGCLYIYYFGYNGILICPHDDDRSKQVCRSPSRTVHLNRATCYTLIPSSRSFISLSASSGLRIAYMSKALRGSRPNKSQFRPWEIITPSIRSCYYYYQWSSLRKSPTSNTNTMESAEQQQYV
jgi:hypothetical protein